MIAKHPEERLLGPGEILLNETTLIGLLAVRHDMTGWTYAPEPTGTDAWNPAATSGDCEDWCLATRRCAASKGFPREAFRVALCRNEAGADHAALIVATDRGDFVLDVRKPGLWAWAELPYQWIAVECPRYGWRAIAKAANLGDLTTA